VTVSGLKNVELTQRSKKSRVKEMNEPKVPEGRAFKVTLILLVGLAAFSTAVKDLNRLHKMVSSVQDLTSQWRGTDLAMLNVESISTNESCPESSSLLVNSSVESDSSESVAPARGMGSVSSDYWATTEPEVGGKVELVAGRKANRSVPATRAKYALARNLNEEISAKRQVSRWPAHFEFKTFDRIVTMGLPITVVTDIEAGALETEVSSDFPLSLLRKISRKQSHGKTDNGRPELILKRFERNNSSRRAS
jgi:hypothetical protein